MRAWIVRPIRSGGLDIAVPHRIYAPSGRWIELSHEGRFGDHRCLSSIVDRSGLELLSVTYENNLITYHLHPNFGETRYEIALKDRWVERVTLPTHDRGSWRFKYVCESETGDYPRNAKGRPIKEQSYEFDDLDNLTYSRTDFADGEKDKAYFTCEGFQLKNATHTHPDYLPSMDFAYDDDGNMLNDELGHKLRYDESGRLQEVRSQDDKQTLLTYRYDGHGHLIGAKAAGEEEELRRYQGNRLVCTRAGTTELYYLHDGERPLGLQHGKAPAAPRLYWTNMANSVIAESAQADLKDANYTAWGDTPESLALTGLLAFNGEVREWLMGWYLLGRGYRAYNPGLMRFHSPDELDQEDVGINPYLYCNGNPVMWRDPTGHAASPMAPPDQPASKPKKGSKLVAWIMFGVSVAIAAVTLGTFAHAALGAAATVTAGIALGSKTVTGLVLGASGNVLVLTGIGFGATSITEKDPKKANIYSWVSLGASLGGGGLAGLGTGLTKTGLARDVAKFASISPANKNLVMRNTSRFFSSPRKAGLDRLARKEQGPIGPPEWVEPTQQQGADRTSITSRTSIASETSITSGTNGGRNSVSNGSALGDIESLSTVSSVRSGSSRSSVSDTPPGSLNRQSPGPSSGQNKDKVITTSHYLNPDPNAFIRTPSGKLV